MDLKINQVTAPTQVTDTNQVNGPSDDAFRFTLMSAIEEEGLQERLGLMYEDITMQGNKITKHMDVKDMKRYRALIKEFMNEIVNRSHTFSR